MRPQTIGMLVLTTLCAAALLCAFLLPMGLAVEQSTCRSDTGNGRQVTLGALEETGKEKSQESEKEPDPPVQKKVTKKTGKETADVAEHAYVGVRTCKMCHMPYFKAWSSTPHAKALSALGGEKKQDKNPKCVKCHVTGFGRGGYQIGKDAPDLANVQCEACHGPGADYKSLPVMKDVEKAKAAGLIFPVTENVCVKCHNEESPKFEGFDFDKYLAKGVHDIDKKADEKTEKTEKTEKEAGKSAGK
jgi:hypothetical protein